jgi:hypothetical protein
VSYPLKFISKIIRQYAGDIEQLTDACVLALSEVVRIRVNGKVPDDHAKQEWLAIAAARLCKRLTHFIVGAGGSTACSEVNNNRRRRVRMTSAPT